MRCYALRLKISGSIAQRRHSSYCTSLSLPQWAGVKQTTKC